MTAQIDWSSDPKSLKRKLLSLSKPKLIKLCRSHKIKYNGNKNVMIDRLIKNVLPSTESNIKPSHYKHKKKPIIHKNKYISTLRSEKFAFQSFIASGYIRHSLHINIVIPNEINTLCCKYFGHELIATLYKCTKDGNPKLMKKLIISENTTVVDIIGECINIKPCEFENKLFDKQQWFRLWRKCNGNNKKSVKWKLITKPNDLLSNNNLNYSNYIEFMVDIFDAKKRGQYKKYDERSKKRWENKLQVGDLVEIKDDDEDLYEWQQKIRLYILYNIYCQNKNKKGQKMYRINNALNVQSDYMYFPYSHYPYYPIWLQQKIFHIAKYFTDCKASILRNDKKLPDTLYSIMNCQYSYV